jgi:hypothetical protein
MSIVKKIRKHGLRRSAQIASGVAVEAFAKWMTRKAPAFENPTLLELAEIEEDLVELGVRIVDYTPDADEFKAFQAADYFPHDYHGGRTGSVWDEKLLEHWLAAERLGLREYTNQDVYIDVAAGGSPWAKSLRDKFGMSAFAIDLSLDGSAYKDLPFYRIENATATGFEDASVKGASLQCAYEMFMGDDDTNFLKEFARILKPGGKIVILPLYLHTHYSAYSSPECYGRGNSDPLAKEYICREWKGIPSARFYDASALKRRVLDPIENLGMQYQILALRNKADYGKNIYCHFILEITK